MRIFISTVIGLIIFNNNSYAGNRGVRELESAFICTGTSFNKKVIYAVGINGNHGKMVSTEKIEGEVEYFNFALAEDDYRVFLQTDEKYLDGIFPGHKLLVYDFRASRKISVFKMTEDGNKKLAELNCVQPN